MALYPWIKALHIVSVIAWMAGLLYLPRLFVYHADAPPGSDAAETFKVMERRLLRGIMHPAMVVTYLFGIAARRDAGHRRLAAGLDLGEARPGAGADRRFTSPVGGGAGISPPTATRVPPRFYRIDQRDADPG